MESIQTNRELFSLGRLIGFLFFFPSVIPFGSAEDG